MFMNTLFVGNEHTGLHSVVLVFEFVFACSVELRVLSHAQGAQSRHFHYERFVLVAHLVGRTDACRKAQTVAVNAVEHHSEQRSLRVCVADVLREVGLEERALEEHRPVAAQYSHRDAVVVVAVALLVVCQGQCVVLSLLHT